MRENKYEYWRNTHEDFRKLTEASSDISYISSVRYAHIRQSHGVGITTITQPIALRMYKRAWDRIIENPARRVDENPSI